MQSSFFFFSLKFLAWCSLIVNYFIDLTMQFIRARNNANLFVILIKYNNYFYSKVYLVLKIIISCCYFYCNSRSIKTNKKFLQNVPFMSGNHILNEGESKGEQKVEQVLKERLAHRLILGGCEYGPLPASSSQLFLSQENSLIEGV